MSNTKDIFITHNWGSDNSYRDNHARCKELAYILVNKGYSVWFDNFDIVDNIDKNIIEGINNSKVVLICLTEKYCNKISNGTNNQVISDNCYKEWNYCLSKGKKIIPIVLEENLFKLKSSEIIQMYINSIFYIDMSKNITDNIDLLSRRLLKHNVYSVYESRASNKITEFYKKSKSHKYFRL